MSIPNKNNPNLTEYDTSLETLNRLTHFILNLNADISMNFKEDALKVIECLKFIKINPEYIAYAVEHRDDPKLYTYPADIAKGVIRDFSDTAIHFNAYNSKEQVKTGLENLIKQFENAIKVMQEAGKLIAFAQKLQFDGDVGCIEQRTAKALLFASTYLSSRTSHDLDDLMEKCQFVAEDDELTLFEKAKIFFKPFMGQICIWKNQEYCINNTLIRQYLTEVFAAEFLITEKLLDALEDKNNPACLELIEKVDPYELEQTVLIQGQGFKILQSVLQQESTVCLAFIHKLNPEVMNKLFQDSSKHLEKMKYLKSVLQNQPIEVCLALLEKIDRLGNFKFKFKDKLSIFWKTFSERAKTAELKMLGFMTLLTAIPSIGLIVVASLLILTLSLLVFAITLSCLLFPFFLISAVHFLKESFNSVRSVIVLTNKETNLDNLLNDLFDFQSAQLVVLFLNKLSILQRKQIILSLESLRLKKVLPYFLFAPDCELSSESMDVYYDYLSAHQSLKKDLLTNRHFLMTSCIDYYFEGKPANLHPKLIDLFVECLNKKSLSAKEHAFLQALKEEPTSFPEITATEIECNGVASWSHYRHLRQKKDDAMQVALDELLLTDCLFQGISQSFKETKDSEFVQEGEDFIQAYRPIHANKGLAKTVKEKDYKKFIRQLEDLNYRPKLRISASHDKKTKKFVHLSGQIVDYVKKHHKKEGYTHTKKTSTTLLSDQLITPLYDNAVGFLFDQAQCKVKARLGKCYATFYRQWVGNETQVLEYQRNMQTINEIDEKKFIAKVKHSRNTNEVLAQLNIEALQAIITTRNTPKTFNLALLRQNELRKKFPRLSCIPIIFYNPSQRLIGYYRLKQMNHMAKKLMLTIYRFCLEKEGWELGLLGSRARIEKKAIPKTIYFIKELVEDAERKEHDNNNANDYIWLDVKQKIESKLHSSCKINTVSQFFKGRSADTQIFYQDLKDFIDERADINELNTFIKPAI